LNAGEVIAVVGATATGKSALADALAAHIGGEVVSADSMQVYQGMDIGTAKVPAEERSVPHHCIDLVAPGQPFTAALYQRLARAAISDIQARGRRVVFCGGTGLYLRAALDDFDLDEAREGEGHGDEHEATGQRAGRDARERLSRTAAELGASAFHARLAEADPRSAELIHPNNVRRVVRAFELIEQGLSYAESSAGFARYVSLYAVRHIGLEVERDLLYRLIEKRVDAMLSAGLLGEVQVLRSEGLSPASTASQAIGYRQLMEVLDGRCTLAQATLAIKQATRRYAKRQQTWFKRDPRIEWMDVSDLMQGRLDGIVDDAGLRQQLLWRALALIGE
jgi:tRNA dimethylallyltransferase